MDRALHEMLDGLCAPRGICFPLTVITVIHFTRDFVISPLRHPYLSTVTARPAEGSRRAGDKGARAYVADDKYSKGLVACGEELSRLSAGIGSNFIYTELLYCNYSVYPYNGY